ncbi:MAG TPA: histidine phosphatase family protein [Methylomirabilota bacterium]
MEPVGPPHGTDRLAADRARRGARAAAGGPDPASWPDWAARSRVEHDLVEWNYGDYEGRTSTKIRAGRPDWELFRDGWNETPHAEVTR